MNPIDQLLNKLTMYRLVVYGLATFVGLSILFAFTGRVSNSPTALVLSLSLLLASSYATDRIFSRLFKTPTNMDSSLITALILFLILHPANTVSSCLALLLAGVIANASKFLLAFNGKHIFLSLIHIY